ncbi:MAG TPA: hypothetical protein VJZ27_13560, partial [Aggregatilineales bacterium]|nr:hypothetical protein [Aggregatilineales bacterium]
QAQIDRTLNPFLLYISVPDASIFYAGNKPLMLVYMAPFFLMGLLYAAYHWQKPGALLLFLWLLLPPMGVSLLIESGISVRFVVVFPAMVLAAAVGIRYVLPRLLPHRFERYAFPMMIVLVLMIGAGQVYYYFNPHLEAFNRQFRLTKLYPDGEDAIFRSQDLPAGTHAVLISSPVFQRSYTKQVFDYFKIPLSFECLTPEQVTDSYLESLSPNRDYAFFIPLNDTRILERLQAHFRLQPPRRSPYADDIPDQREFLLFFAPHFELDTADPVEWQ